MNINIKIPQDVEEIMGLLEENGYDAYIVGGCVRDSVLGRKPHDWDICTSATPDEVIRVFSEYKVIETGIKHGTVTIVMNGWKDDIRESYEVTTFRKDGEYSDNRRPDEVSFTESIIEDLSRRDFTINAIAYSHITGIIDPFDGMGDIEKKLIRCVGVPEERFEEDGLRILRAMRFSIQLDFSIWYFTFTAMIRKNYLLKNISKERISSELVKMIVSENFTHRVIYSLLIDIIPELEECHGFDQNNKYHDYDVYTHIMKAVDNYKGEDKIVKLSLLLHDIGKPKCYSEDENGGHFYEHGVVGSDMAQEILQRLKFDGYTVKSVTELVLYHDGTIHDTPKSVKKWLNKIGEVQLRRLITIRIADILAHSELGRDSRVEKQERIFDILDKVIIENQAFSIADLDINGKDLIGLGIEEGENIGNMLRYLLEKVISDEVENEKTCLLKIAEETRREINEMLLP